MSFASQVKYSRLTDLDDDAGSKAAVEIRDMKGDQNFSFDSIYTYKDESTKGKYKNKKNDFDSIFKFNHMTAGRPRGHLALDVREDLETDGAKPSNILVATSYLLTILSYFVFAITLPLTYWFFVKKLGEFDRLVVFRLGKMIGVKGPGRVIIFPWMDRTKKVDVRAAAFSVPPQQLITCDGGIVEMGAEIQYGIVDVVTMVSEVADHQDILRSLSKTLMIKILVKKSVRQIEKERRRPATEIQDEINLQVRQWGIDVQKVELSEPKILKQSDNGGNSAVGSILKGLGMKKDPEYPTPQEFVRMTHGLDEAPQQSALPGGGADMNISLLQMMSNMGAQSSGVPGIVVPPDESPAVAPEVFSWGKCLEVIVEAEFSGPLEDDACGLYQLEITETPVGIDTYYISLSSETKFVTQGLVSPDGRSPDVSVQISSSDLASVLEGTLAPLQAYLTGRISATGDVRKLMLFDKLSKRGHKPGAMFSV